MEIVVICITKSKEKADDVDNSWRWIVSGVLLLILDGEDLRAGEGFFPKYRARYLANRPLAWTSGAEPRGNFS